MCVVLGQVVCYKMCNRPKHTYPFSEKADLLMPTGKPDIIFTSGYMLKGSPLTLVRFNDQYT